MNIALFSDCYTPIKNGVVTSLLQLKEGLEKIGHNVYVVTVEAPGYIVEDPRVLRLPSFRVGLGSELRFTLAHQVPIYLSDAGESNRHRAHPHRVCRGL
jgi:1,2-diacylglycerol 3-alpha-glucosyltransferase